MDLVAKVTIAIPGFPRSAFLHPKASPTQQSAFRDPMGPQNPSLRGPDVPNILRLHVAPSRHVYADPAAVIFQVRQLRKFFPGSPIYVMSSSPRQSLVGVEPLASARGSESNTVIFHASLPPRRAELS